MSGFAKSFRDLDVYGDSLKLIVEVHQLCKGLPVEEKYVLADQMRRASRSICANIAEAWRKRRYEGAFVAKMSDAETEACEMQCWLDVALRLEYIDKKQYEDFDARYEKIISQIVNMIRNSPKWCQL